MSHATLRGLAACFTFAAAAPLAAQAPAVAPTHAYRINGSLADELGGPSLAALGGAVGPAGYTFGTAQGLTLANALAPSVYSLEMAFRLDAVTGYRKVLDFKNRTQDFGFYVQNGAATFAGQSTSGTSPFRANTLAHLVLTRDAEGRFTAYVDGVQALSFVDATGMATFTGPGAVAYLMQDDLSGFEEHPSGFVDYVRTYDRALTGAEAAARFAAGDDALPGQGPGTPPVSTVPEPATVALLGGGVLLLGALARRRTALGA
jgi:hypothetical protein